MTAEIKPCPFCKSKDVRVHENFYHSPFEKKKRTTYNIHCSVINCHGNIFSLNLGGFKSKKQAIESWNKRG